MRKEQSGLSTRSKRTCLRNEVDLLPIPYAITKVPLVRNAAVVNSPFPAEPAFIPFENTVVSDQLANIIWVNFGMCIAIINVAAKQKMSPCDVSTC